MNRSFRLLLILVALAGGAALWLAIHLDNLVEDAIAGDGSAMTKGAISVGTVRIASASGKSTIGMLTIGNPPGFRTTHAFKAGVIEIDMDLASLATDVVVIRVITINGPDVIYEHGETTTNFDAIQNNIAAYLGRAPASKAGSETKLIVEELTIYNATAWANAPFMGGKFISIPLPDITLRNIGKGRGGISPNELGQEIAIAMNAKLSGAANFERLRKSTDEALVLAGAAIKVKLR